MSTDNSHRENSRKEKRFVGFVAVLTAVLVLVSFTYGAPGDATDPLVSQSYVDRRISEVVKLIGQQTNGGTSVLTALSESDYENLITDIIARIEFYYGNDLGSEQNGVYRPVFLSKGQTLVGMEGTEIILRSGNAVCYTDVDFGLVDITTGAEMKKGSKLVANHMNIVPRGDGRGVTALEDAWFMVKGDYFIN